MKAIIYSSLFLALALGSDAFGPANIQKVRTTTSTTRTTTTNENANHKVHTSSSLRMYFDFEDEPILIPQEKYDALLQSTLPDTQVSISKSTIGHGHGLYTAIPLPANTIAFTIPLEKCFTLENVRSHPDLGRVLTIMQEDLGDEEGPIASLSAFLASEMLREQCAEWEEDLSLSGPYSEYIKILPSGRAVSEQDHVLWWSNEEVERLFQGGAAYDKAMALKDWVQSEGEIIEGMLVSDLAQKMMGLSISQVRGAVTTAFVNVLNRSLFNEGGEQQRLVPVLDMCAHSCEPNLECMIDKCGNVVVSTKRDIQAGEELSIKFYSTEFEGHEWYVMYGFIVPYAAGSS